MVKAAFKWLLPTETAETHYDKAVAHYNAGRYARAIGRLDKALLQNSDYLMAYMLKGDASLALGEYNQAADCFQEAIRRNPCSDTYTGKAYAYLGLDDITQALAYFSAALELNPAHKAALTGRGKALFAAESYKEAMGVFIDLPITIELIQLCDRLGFYDEGITYCNTFLANRPDHKQIAQLRADMVTRKASLTPEQQQISEEKAATLLNYSSLKEHFFNPGNTALMDSQQEASLLMEARSFFHAGNYGEALRRFNRTLQVNPENVAALNGKGDVFMKWHCAHEAMLNFKEALSYDPKNSHAHTQKGLLHIVRGEEAKAIKSFSKALKYDPSNGLTYLRKGDILLKKGEYQRALSDYDNAIIHGQNNETTQSGKGLALLHLERYPEALESFKEALTRNPDYNEALHGQGIAHLKLKNYEEAQNSFTRLLQQQPDNPAALQGRGDTFLEQEDYLLALDDYTTLLALQPKNITALLAAMGKCHAMLQQPSEALSYYDRLLSIDPTHKEALQGKADIHFEQHSYEQALISYNTILRMGNTAPIARLYETLSFLGYQDESDALQNSLSNNSPITQEIITSVLNITGHVLFALQHEGEAMANFSHILDYSPEDAQALQGKNRVIARWVEDASQEKALKALKIYNTILTYDHENIPALNGQGECYLTLEDSEMAIECFSEVLGLAPENTQALERKNAILAEWNAEAASLYEQGKKEQAQKIYDRILGYNEHNIEAPKGSHYRNERSPDPEGTVIELKPYSKVNQADSSIAKRGTGNSVV